MLPGEADRLRAGEAELLSIEDVGHLVAHCRQQLTLSLDTGLGDGGDGAVHAEGQAAVCRARAQLWIGNDESLGGLDESHVSPGGINARKHVGLVLLLGLSFVVGKCRSPACRKRGLGVLSITRSQYPQCRLAASSLMVLGQHV